MCHTHSHCHYLQVINVNKVIPQDMLTCVDTCVFAKHATGINMNSPFVFFSFTCLIKLRCGLSSAHRLKSYRVVEC